MRVVINIDDNLYTRLFDNGVDNYDDAEDMATAIRKGTVLPKGCGDLIDISNINVIELEDSTHIIRHEKGDEIDTYISAPIIVEKDETENEGANESNN